MNLRRTLFHTNKEANNQVVCLTTFRQGRADNPVERVRSEVFLDTAENLKKFGIPLVTLFTDTSSSFRELLDYRGVILVEQQSVGMGRIRREALASACSLFPDADYYCWLEPEKPNLVRFIPTMTGLMSRELSVLGLFNRIRMQSYPAEQAYYYLFCRAVATSLVGFDLDYAFGPMVISPSVVRCFLEYQGEYGDKWDAILIPRLRVIKQGVGISLLPIDFQNDPRMTAVESGNPAMILKRVEQFNNVVPSLIQEWEKLNSI